MDEFLLQQIDRAAENYAVEIYPSRRGLLLRRQWRARVVSEHNGRTILASSESYNNREELEDICALILPHVSIRRVPR